MATAVTLKESDGTEIYPVTDISLVNGGIHADNILPASSVAPITTDQIQDGAVTSPKIDWTTVTTTQIIPTKNSTYVGNTETVVARQTVDGMVWVGITFTLAATVSAGAVATLFTGLPASLHQFDIVGLDSSNGSTCRMRMNYNGTSVNMAYDAKSHASGHIISATFCYPSK